MTFSSPSLALPKRGKFFLFSIRLGTNILNSRTLSVVIVLNFSPFELVFIVDLSTVVIPLNIYLNMICFSINN